MPDPAAIMPAGAIDPEADETLALADADGRDEPGGEGAVPPPDDDTTGDPAG